MAANQQEAAPPAKAAGTIAEAAAGLVPNWALDAKAKAKVARDQAKEKTAAKPDPPKQKRERPGFPAGSAQSSNVSAPGTGATPPPKSQRTGSGDISDAPPLVAPNPAQAIGADFQPALPSDAAEDDDRQGGGRRRRRGGRRKRSDQKIGVKDAGLIDLLKVLTQQVAILSLRTRRLQAIVCDTFIGPTAAPVFATLRETISDYYDLVRAAKGGDDVKTSLAQIGSPTPYVWVALISFLESADVGASNRGAVSALRQRLCATAPDEAVTREAVEAATPLCVLEKCADAGKTKLIFATDYSERNAIIQSLIQLGLSYCVGSAPAGYLENELEGWNDYFSSLK